MTDLSILFQQLILRNAPTSVHEKQHGDLVGNDLFLTNVYDGIHFRRHILPHRAHIRHDKIARTELIDELLLARRIQNLEIHIERVRFLRFRELHDRYRIRRCCC